MQKKLSMIFTGGTISMIRGLDLVLRPPKDPSEFAQSMPKELFKDRMVSFTFALNKDSTDMMPADWQTITSAVIDELNEKSQPDGILVVHGVDTICFTASAVAYALGPRLNCPVVFTGAQLPADKVHGDAMVNLLRSAEIACSAKEQGLNEVMTFFNTRAFRGCRAQKLDDKDFDALISPAFPPLVVVKDPLEFKHQRKDASSIDKKPGYMNKFTTGILPIPLVPGNEVNIHLSALESEQCKGVVLFSFGGHTIPTVENGHNYLPLLKKAQEQEIPVLLASHYPTITTDYNLYDSGKKAAAAGAIPVSGYVLPALIAKFSWLLAHTKKIPTFSERHRIIKTIMEKPYVGEIGDTDFSDTSIWQQLIDLSPPLKKDHSSTAP